MHPSVNYFLILIFVINYQRIVCKLTKRFARHRFHQHRPVKNRTSEQISDKISPDKMKFYDNRASSEKTQQNSDGAFISKNNNFFLKCPRSSDEHWHNKINFTVDWRRDGISYLTIRKRNQFPKLEIAIRYLKHQKWIFKHMPGSRKSALSIQQWPNIDGQSASAIIYLNPNPKNSNVNMNAPSKTQHHYKFEAEERRQWFALRIPEPNSRLDRGVWECRVIIYTKVVSVNNDKVVDYETRTRKIQLESRKLLTGHERHHQLEPLAEFQKTAKRKTRMNNIDAGFYLKNALETSDDLRSPKTQRADIETKPMHDYSELDIDDDVPLVKNKLVDELFSFAKSDDNSMTISRRKLPNDIAFTRGEENVEFTRADSEAAENEGEENDIDDNESNSINYEPFGPPSHKIVPLLAQPTSDGLFWKNWFQDEKDDDEEFQNEISANEHRSFWWQNADNYSHSTKQLSTFFKFCSIFVFLQQVILNQRIF